MRRLTFSLIPLALVVAPWASPGVSAGNWGAGAHLVTSSVYRDSARSGPAVQPSAWMYVGRFNTLVNAWASVRLQDPRVDDIILDARTGIPLSDRAWGGITAHWDWRTPTVDTLDFHSLEFGAVLTWFNPPYRPTLSVNYDVVRQNGLLTVVSIPYTLRLGWLPPTTFIPEFAFRSGGGHGVLGIEYLAFTMLTERRASWLTVIPMAGVVPKGGLRGWLLWGGLSLVAVR